MALIWQPLSLVALAIAVYVGLELPDVDQRVGFLLHRSIITHGPLFPLLAFVLSLSDSPVRRRLGAGIALGFAVHMAFDLFPRSWQGYALVSIPSYGWMPSVVSWIWIAATMLFCMGLAMKLIHHVGDGMLLLLALALAFVYASGSEEAFWLPLAAIIASLVVAYAVVKPTRQRNRSVPDKE